MMMPYDIMNTVTESSVLFRAETFPFSCRARGLSPPVSDDRCHFGRV